MVCGVAITLGLWRFGHFEMMIPVWMVCYGAAVACGGAFSVKVIPIMGWCFLVLGAAAFAMPAGYGNGMMAASFGLPGGSRMLLLGLQAGVYGLALADLAAPEGAAIKRLTSPPRALVTLLAAAFCAQRIFFVKPGQLWKVTYAQSAKS